MGERAIRLSVIVPTLDKLETARLLGERVRCLLDGLATEIIIISPKSLQTDDLADIRYVQDRGRGVYAAYTQGLRMARGEYVWFIGDDDYPLDAVSDLAALIERNDADVIVGPVIFSQGRIYRPPTSRLLLLFRNWCQQGVIYRRALFRNRPFFGRMKTQADHYVNIRFRLDSRVKVKFVKDPLCVFGIHGLSSRIRVDSQFLAVRSSLARHYLGSAEFLAFLLLLGIRRVLLAVRRGMAIGRNGLNMGESR